MQKCTKSWYVHTYLIEWRKLPWCDKALQMKTLIGNVVVVLGPSFSFMILSYFFFHSLLPSHSSIVPKVGPQWHSSFFTCSKRHSSMVGNVLWNRIVTLVNARSCWFACPPCLTFQWTFENKLLHWKCFKKLCSEGLTTVNSIIKIIGKVIFL